MAKNTLFRVALFGGYNKEDVYEYIQTLENEIEAVKVLNQKEKNELQRQLDESREQQAEDSEALLKMKEELENSLLGLKEKEADLNRRIEEAQKSADTIREEKNELQRQLDESRERQAEDSETILKMKEELRYSSVGLKEKEEDLNRKIEEAQQSADIIIAEARKESEQIVERAVEDAEKQKEIVIARINAELEEKRTQLIAAKHKIDRYMKALNIAQQGLYNIYKRMNRMVASMPVSLDDYLDGESYKALENNKEPEVSAVEADLEEELKTAAEEQEQTKD